MREDVDPETRSCLRCRKSYGDLDFYRKKYRKPTYIGLKDHSRSCWNTWLFANYRLIRFFFVTCWFYYFPVLIMTIGYLYLFFRY